MGDASKKMGSNGDFDKITGGIIPYLKSKYHII